MSVNKAVLRSNIFSHLDGIATAPVAIALHDRGVLQHIMKNENVELEALSKLFKANAGYLNVALRVLASQGWLVMSMDPNQENVNYQLTGAGRIAFDHASAYTDVVTLINTANFSKNGRPDFEPFNLFERLFRRFENSFGISISDNSEVKAVQNQILKHIEGVLVGPVIVRLAMSGMFHKYFMEASFSAEEFHEEPKKFEAILDFLTYLGWFEKRGSNYMFTDTGVFFAKRATAYGVTVSYLPTFRQLDQLIFGNPTVLRAGEGNEELHVDRAMNVWGSGGAHTGYFKVVDEIIIDLFNRPIDLQPKGILDMGCGNGAFLKHVFGVIDQYTERGKMLDDHPLFLVGADYNQAALKITRANLIEADIWAKTVWGDIGRPDLLAADLKSNYNIELKDLLNVRTFLDHNRPWSNPEHDFQNRKGTSSGAFASNGRRLSASEVEQNLLEHLQRWTPYVERFGLCLIELHTIPPSLTANNLGKTPATAYDATHGFSDQYIVEIDVFQRIAKEAGLVSDEALFKKFPNSELATVSINLLKVK